MCYSTLTGQKSMALDKDRNKAYFFINKDLSNLNKFIPLYQQHDHKDYQKRIQV